MFRTRLARALLIPAALMIPASAATLALTLTTGSAASALTPSASCKSLSGKVNLSSQSATGNLTKCSDTKNTGGKGKFSGSNSSSTATITWANGGVTKTSFAFTLTSPPNNCTGSQAGDTEIIVTGTVTSSTGKAKSIKKGEPLSADVCWNTTTNTIALRTGTTFTV